jgi:hypothetical protein
MIILTNIMKIIFDENIKLNNRLVKKMLNLIF